MCPVCGGRGVIEVADVHRNQSTGMSEVFWELSRIVTCGCREAA